MLYIKRTISIALFLLLTTINITFSASHVNPALQHATTYKTVTDITQYWVSEKLDGIRGFWDGEKLITRQGNLIHSPDWFTQHWPTTPMDGELWIAREQFQLTLSCTRKVTIDEKCWRKIRFMIFDLPEHQGTFTKRVHAMKEITNHTASPYLSMIKQMKLENLQQLNNMLNRVVTNQGEGLMLHRSNAYYYVGRTDNIMKLKQHQDAEATVIGHIGGKGKYQGMLGALKVRTDKNIVFKIGSGFSDKERANPPEIGSIITYRYNGKTKAGIPRFARFYRVRE